MIGACRESLPETELRGCLFHYMKCLKKKRNDYGLNKFKTPQIKQIYQLFRALPFVPTHLLYDAFLMIENFSQSTTAEAHECCTKFCRYFIQTWLDECSGRFPPATWNCFNKLSERTNNSIEGWHSRLAKRMGKGHPTLVHFFEILRNEQDRAFFRNLTDAKPRNNSASKDKIGS